MNAERIKRGLKTPSLFGREVNRKVHTRFGQRLYNTDGVDVFSEDWDNLVVLDACRLDMFDDQVSPHIDGSLETRTSRGSSTVEWLESNVFNRDLSDTVYITANPQYYRNATDCDEFHAVIEVWDSERWDDDRHTVPPDAMTDAILEGATEYPHKRLLCHYIQPHFPFLGPTTRDHPELNNIQNLAIWRDVFSGDINVSDDVLRQAFRETLDVAVPAIVRAVDSLEGKTVLTADHGQMIGERSAPVPIREYGHPRQTYTDKLVTVPWFICETEARREIHSDNSENVTGIDSKTATNVEERLADLGYV
ncbi:hypothetical protein OB905_10820 [Halobacteria archaeon AArc-dxtr1]|nr:hypothetical protein [Halobacteria archaeon AArc-dxtr1]